MYIWTRRLNETEECAESTYVVLLMDSPNISRLSTSPSSITASPFAPSYIPFDTVHRAPPNTLTNHIATRTLHPALLSSVSRSSSLTRLV